MDTVRSERLPAGSSAALMLYCAVYCVLSHCEHTDAELTLTVLPSALSKNYEPKYTHRQIINYIKCVISLAREKKSN